MNLDLPGKVYLINEDDSIIASNQMFKINEELMSVKNTFELNLFEDKLRLIYIQNQEKE